MSNVNTLLTERLKKSEKSSKIAVLAQRSAAGQLTSFSGVFNISELSSFEKEELAALLHDFSHEKQSVKNDLETLISITAEVKAINNQGALLHGERIKKAQTLLKSYKDGAFTAWLIKTYGNRQTPYNFLQYYEFHESMPKELHNQIEQMPRQAIYTLASREGSPKDKSKLIANYKGETKEQLLQNIREFFPLKPKDRRNRKPQEKLMKNLVLAFHQTQKYRKILSSSEKKALIEILDSMKEILK